MPRESRLVALLAALAVLMLVATQAASASVRSFPAASQHRGVAVFKLKRVAPSRIARASVRVGRHRARVAVAKARRGAKRGVLRVRVPAAAIRSRRARSSRRQPKAKLVLAVSDAPTAQTPVPAATTSATTAPSAGPAEPLPTTLKATTRPPGSAPLSDAEAASRVRRASFEPRPSNAPYNSRVPSAAEVAAYRAEPTSTPEVQYEKVTGNFTGTTDEIIQWAAHKWGLDEEKLRAVAAQESWWTQSYVGDGGHSPGLFQMRHDPVKLPVGHRLVRDYTAFNADLYGAFVRYYFDGSCSWCNDAALTRYAGGQEWMSIGAHFNPYPWGNAGQLDYIEKVKNYLAQRVWEGPEF